jgi:hypothetical protein
MKRQLAVLALLALLASGPAAQAAGLEIALTPDPGNPAAPRMGDRVAFHSVIRNTGATPIHGLTAWLGLVETTPGHEQPVDLEDWSAHKAVTAPVLAPGRATTVEWPVRLIRSGDYRVVISAAARDAAGVVTSPVVDFRVAPKPVVESRRILPVALGVPALLAIWLAGLGLRRRVKHGLSGSTDSTDIAGPELAQPPTERTHS